MIAKYFILPSELPDTLVTNLIHIVYAHYATGSSIFVSVMKNSHQEITKKETALETPTLISDVSFCSR